MENKKYSDFLKGKRICLVGPAGYMVGSELGEEIDSYDIVVRLNKAHPVPIDRRNDIGSRIDVLYHCLNQGEDAGGKIDFMNIKNDIKWLAMPYPKVYPFDRDVHMFKQINKMLNIPFTIIDVNKYNEVIEEIKTRPNSGVLSMIDLLNHDIKELHLVGFTFFKGGYDLSYRSTFGGKKAKTSEESEDFVKKQMAMYGNHSIEPQFNYFKSKIVTDSRVTLDETMKKILGI